LSLKSLPAALKTAALSLGLLLQAPAHAGLISGSWDPLFGSALPGLNWSAYAELSVPDACTNTSGPQTVASGVCAGSKVLAVFLQLYDTGFGALDWSNPASYASSPPGSATFAICDSSVSGNSAYTSRCNSNFGNYFGLSALRIDGGSVVGLQASVGATFAAVNPGGGPDSWPSTALRNNFTLDFGLDGPSLFCVTCPDGPVKSSSDGLRQFFVTYTSNDTSTPKFTDSTGKALGVVLDDKGQVLGRATSINAQFVPEPGGLALVLAALGAAALARRRRGLPATAARRHAP
jgi:hypothetical protein